jgi:adenine-specific DNA methylase
MKVDKRKGMRKQIKCKVCGRYIPLFPNDRIYKHYKSRRPVIECKKSLEFSE